MKFVEPKVMLFTEGDPFIKIEKIGRICYKSDSEYTRETAMKFIKTLTKSGHLSVLEHAVFHFICDGFFNYLNSNIKFGHRTCVSGRNLVTLNLRELYEKQEYLNLFIACLYRNYPDMGDLFFIHDCYEQIPDVIKLVDIKQFDELSMDEINKHLYTSIYFETDRGVTHEMVRHRIASYTQESTRYCNYSKDKFGGELTFIRPATFDEWNMGNRISYTQALEYAELAYLGLTKESENTMSKSLTAQLARGILPNDLKTTIVMTTNHASWEHFFDLRSRGITGAPHPNMKKVAKEAETLYLNQYNDFISKFVNK